MDTTHTPEDAVPEDEDFPADEEPEFDEDADGLDESDLAEDDLVEDLDEVIDDVIEDESDEDEDGGEDEEDEEAEEEALDELEAEELDMLTDDEESETLAVDEAAVLRDIRRAEMSMDEEGAGGVKADEFVCSKCYLVKRSSQLADRRRKICRDCAD